MYVSQLDDSQSVRVEKEKTKEINIKALYAVIRKRIWLIALITIAVTFLAGLYNNRPEPLMYASNSRMIVAASSDMIGTVRVLFREPLVLNEIIEQLGINRSVAQLRGQIRIDSVDGSLVTVVSVVDSDPKLAAEIANTGVEIYKRVASETLGVTSIRLLTQAEENPIPINEQSNTVVLIGFMFGLILSIGLVFLLDSLDDSIKSEREIEELLGLTMLGQVTKIKRKDYSRYLKKRKTIVVRGETIGS
ncbi:capsular polysaccharide biosynthesis protein [Paenibacillus endophyticus]|uniref:Capsular polysaccharide biosynthesis protein n=1 Tax=Paenibacillus endophyticus TaxID=1294268 RepID=A0A7W5C2H3_9BACL|nr:Wzz/FepE/Etk N-terminal domain-containing protein [Paenibacillus endophyticus]MBB3150031.1 capsular polysaccharide biosynthesis protein [Paenibacillus endophyticus]